MRILKKIVIPGVLAGSLVGGLLAVGGPASAEHSNGGIAQAADVLIGLPPLPAVALPQQLCLTIAGTPQCQPTNLGSTSPSDASVRANISYILSSSTHPTSVQSHTGFVCPDTAADPDTYPNLGMVWRLFDASYQPGSTFAVQVTVGSTNVTNQKETSPSNSKSSVSSPVSEVYLC